MLMQLNDYRLSVHHMSGPTIVANQIQDQEDDKDRLFNGGKSSFLKVVTGTRVLKMDRLRSRNRHLKSRLGNNISDLRLISSMFMYLSPAVNLKMPSLA